MLDESFDELLNIVMKNYPYLIKFQEKETYAKSFLHNGEIFMQSAKYYKELQMQTGIRGQGDIHENEFFNGSLSVGMEFPIYCMYAVHSTQLNDKNIIINKKVVDDFCINGGYITLTETNEFLKQFRMFCNTDNWTAGLVIYGQRTTDADFELLKAKNTAHFFKRKDFDYQQEFRIRINEPLERIELPEDERVIIIKTEKGNVNYWRKYVYKSRTEIIRDISTFSNQYKTEDLRFDGNKYMLIL